MDTELARTHRAFDIDPFKWSEVLQLCKDRFGDTHYLDQHHLRSWVTGGYRLFVRNDLLDDSFTTYLGLVCKIKQST